LAIKGAAFARLGRGKHMITTAIEHPSVLKACGGLTELGFETTILPVDKNALVNVQGVADALRDDTVLVSVMLANNELGTIEPVKEIVELCHARGVWVHSDAVQGLGKIPVDVKELGVDLLSVSAHKLYGPQGIGALYVGGDVKLSSLVHGGDQERGLRAGTENVAGIVGFGKAAELAVQRLSAGELAQMAVLRDAFEGRMREIFEGARVNAAGVSRTPNTTNLVIPGMRGESLVLSLDRYGVYFSSGSACKSGSPDPSHVLRAIGLSDEEAHCCIRLSLGVNTTRDDLDFVCASFERTLRESNNAVQFVGCR
jgi:cysteine sulfinate desulfinase/cysteine desulfurase-like protein